MGGFARRILAVAAVLALTLPAWAGWYQDYTAAKKELDRKRWDSAARLLQRAIADKPASELNARTSGMWREDYLPHFYLGLCYLRLGDFQRAEGEFRAEERAGAIASRADLAAQLRQGLAEIGEKRGATAPGPPPLTPPAPAASPVSAQPQTSPAQTLPSTPATAKSQPQPVPAPTKPQPTPATAMPAAPKPVPPSAPVSMPLPSPRTSPSAKPAGGLDAAARESVLEGFRLAEQGFYARAAEAISSASADRAGDTKLAALLRAYSGSFLYNAYLLSQPPDDALRDRAREAFVEAVKLDPGLVLPERYFSPRVVSFYEGIRSTAGPR